MFVMLVMFVTIYSSLSTRSSVFSMLNQTKSESWLLKVRDKHEPLKFLHSAFLMRTCCDQKGTRDMMHGAPVCRLNQKGHGWRWRRGVGKGMTLKILKMTLKMFGVWRCLFHFVFHFVPCWGPQLSACCTLSSGFTWYCCPGDAAKAAGSNGAFEKE